MSSAIRMIQMQKMLNGSMKAAQRMPDVIVAKCVRLALVTIRCNRKVLDHILMQIVVRRMFIDCIDRRTTMNKRYSSQLEL
jgi:hypothetical protein